MRKDIAKKVFGIVGALILVICIGVFACLSDKISSGGNDGSLTTGGSGGTDVAYAATAPTLSTTLVGASYSNGWSLDSSIRDKTLAFDISSSDWVSTSIDNVKKSILGRFGVEVSMSAYKYDKIIRTYTDNGNTPTPTNPTEIIPEDAVGGTKYCYGIVDNADPAPVKFKSIIADGTTWYGEEITNVDFLAPGSKIVAGKYAIKIIKYTCSAKMEYKVSETIDFYNCSQQYEGDQQEPVIQTAEISLDANEEHIYDASGLNLSVFLRTSVNVDSNLSGYISNNLNVDAEYDSQTVWADRVSLYDAESSDSTHFTYSDGSKKYFKAKSGLLPDLVAGSAFGMDENIIGSEGKIGDKLKIVWYSDEKLAGRVQNEDTLKAGNYYLKIESNNEDKENNDYFYFLDLEDTGKYIQAVEFYIGENIYIQAFEVARRYLKVSIKDRMGLMMRLNEKGVATTAFNSVYAEANVFLANMGKTIPRATYYTYNPETKTYLDASGNNGEGKFSEIVDYYVNKCAIGTAMGNTVAYSQDDTNFVNLWKELGGFENDAQYILAGADVISLRGSYFPGKDIRSYDYVNLFVSIGIKELATNYAIDLGEFEDGVWASYSLNSEEATKSRLVEDGEDKNGFSLSHYVFYGDFEVTAPIIDVDLSEFRLTNEGCYYGEIASSEEIDYSSVNLVGSNLATIKGIALTWDVSTGLEKWRIKVVSSEKEMNDNDGYNYIYVLMRLATEGSNGDYQDANGRYYATYTQTIYARDYYVISSIYFRRVGEATAQKASNMKNGETDVKITSGGIEIGIAKIRLQGPVLYVVNRVKVYLNLIDYSENKFYDGTIDVLNSTRDANATAELKQSEDSGVLSDVIKARFKAETGREIENILQYDLDFYFDPIYKICYSGYMADIGVDEKKMIYCQSLNFNFNKGSISGDVADLIRESYDFSDLSGILRKDDREQTLYGRINRRILDLKVLKNPDRITDPAAPGYSASPYQRGYNSDAYVALRVARYSDVFGGKNLLEHYNIESISKKTISSGHEYYADLYYVYGIGRFERKGGYSFYSDLPEVFNGVSYIFVEIEGKGKRENHGFLETEIRKEGFDWKGTFLEKYYNDADYYPFTEKEGGTENIDLTKFIDWANSYVKDKATGAWLRTLITRESNAGEYLIAIAENLGVLNYSIVLSNELTDENIDGTEIGFEITKIVQDPNVVFSTNPTITYSYDKTDKIERLCTEDTENSYITFTNHRDYQFIRSWAEFDDFINGKRVANFKKMIKVIGYEINWEDADAMDKKVYDPVEFDSDITNIRRAGQYTLEVTTPETDNYKSVTTRIMLVVERAKVVVYTTIGVRTYMSNYSSKNEVSFDGSYRILASTELDRFAAYIDENEFEFVKAGTQGAIKAYVRYKDEDESGLGTIYDTSAIRVYYIGFMNGDDFGNNFNDKQAKVTVDSSSFFVNNKYIDQAGVKKGAITASEAYVRDYSFTYISADLYVKRQSLTLEVDGNQHVFYDGTNLSPVNKVTIEDGTDAPANVKQTVVGYFSKQKVGGGYKYNVLVRNAGSLVVAEMARSENDLRDYYYYFEEFYDETNAPIEVKRVGTRMWFVKGGQEIKLYSSGLLYYYYPGNDKEKTKVYITHKEIAIYTDGTRHYYYDDNDASTAKIYLSRTIEPDFDFTAMEDVGGVMTEVRVSYVDAVDGKNIYLEMVEKSGVISKETVQNVFYDENDNIGGYILRVNAVPGEGASSTNYKDSKTYTVFLAVDVLTIDLLDHSEKGTTGATINPMWNSVYYGKYMDDKYVGEKYMLREFTDYYKGIAGERTVKLGGNWAKSEIATNDDGLPMFAYYSGYGLDLSIPEKADKFIGYQQGNAADFVYANHVNASISDAGLYVILIKVTISDAVEAAGVGENFVNMRKNLKFATKEAQADFNGVRPVASNEYETYFVLYLNMERSTDIELKEIAGSGVTRDDKASGEGYKGTFTKIYNSKKIEFRETLKVTGQASDNGEILGVKAYMLTALDGGNRYDYLENGMVGEWENKIDLSLTHVNNFFIEYVVNATGEENYNNNFATIKSVYRVEIKPKDLKVIVNVIDEESGTATSDPEKVKQYSNKNYGQKNSEVENKFIVTFSGWEGSDEKNLLHTITTMPKFDWERGGLSVENDVDGRTRNAGTDYSLYAKGGKLPVTQISVFGKTITYEDYVFNYDTSIPFEIKKLKMIIGQNNPGVIIDEEKVYEGKTLVPEIKRYGWDGKPLDSGEDANYKKSIVYIGLIENYVPEKEYTENDTNQGVKNAVNVGYYLFRIFIGDSKNYEGIDGEFYWVFKITKSDLYLYFTDENNSIVSGSGLARKTYDGTKSNYPEFYAKYEGFKGEDDVASNKTMQRIKFRIPELYAGYYNGIPFLGLINPLYVFIDKETGEELRNADGSPYTPVNAGTYYVKLVQNEGVYGYADNYNVIVKYNKDVTTGKILYPELIVDKRAVSVSYVENTNDKITKVYDGTDAVLTGSVSAPNGTTAGNYSFNRQTANVGLISGDFISLKINYSSSKYARKTVYDIYDKSSDIDVYLHVEEILVGDDAENYKLDFDNSSTYTEYGVKYIKLCGAITPATVTVKFFNKDGQSTSNLRVEYNGEKQDVNIKVYGVNDEVLVPITEENGVTVGDYSVTYKSATYESSDAPKDCGRYDVVVSIVNKNYVGSLTASLEIIQAQVEITFGGEGTQIYGNITTGLTAIATGVGGYTRILDVQYYTIGENGEADELVSDISLAPAGEYIAVAIHDSDAGDNFAYKRATESFTVRRRDVDIKYDVAPIYKYTGVSIKIEMYFNEYGTKRYPKLIFDRSVGDDKWQPANYSYDENGKIVNIGNNPSDAGEYRVKAYEILDNFIIGESEWAFFKIEKASLTIETKDILINEGESYDVEAVMKNSLTDDPLSSVVSGLKFKYYDTNTGAQLAEKPTAPGTYKVVGYGASAENYTINYTFGILTIYQTKITADSGAGAGDVSVDIEGSFTSGTKISVDKKQSKDYSDINTSFESFKQTNEEYRNKQLNDIFVFSYGDYVASTKQSGSTFRVYAPNLFGANISDAEEISVAVLTSDGSIKVVKAQQEGEYLKFSTDEQMIKAVSIISATKDERSNAYDWVLYLGIALSALVLGLAIFIVVKKA